MNHRTDRSLKELENLLNELPTDSVVYVHQLRSFYKKTDSYSWNNTEVFEQVHPGVLVRMGDFDIVREGGIENYKPEKGKFAMVLDDCPPHVIPDSIWAVFVLFAGEEQSRVALIGQADNADGSHEALISNKWLRPIQPNDDLFSVLKKQYSAE